MTYWADGRYRLDGRPVAADRVRSIMLATVVDRGPEAHWRFFGGPPWIDYYRGPSWRINGKAATVGQVEWFLLRWLVRWMVAKLEDWTEFPILPDLDDLDLDGNELDAEAGTAEVPYEEIMKLYGQHPEGRHTEDLEEERPVPFEKIAEDPVEEVRLAWAHAEIPAFEDTAFGRWIQKAAPGLPIIIAYYVVAHRIVYQDREVAMFGEGVHTRFAPFGRGDAYVELRSRVAQLREESDEPVQFVAGGFKLKVRLLS